MTWRCLRDHDSQWHCYVRFYDLRESLIQLSTEFSHVFIVIHSPLIQCYLGAFIEVEKREGRDLKMS